MRKVLLLITLLCTAAVQSWANPKFETGKKYRIECATAKGGAVVLGQQHNQSFYLYYDTSTSYADDAWWYVNEVADGVYTICNAESKQYMVHDDNEYSNTTGKYLVLADSVPNATSQWSLESTDDDSGYYYVKNQGASQKEYFNLRTNNYLLGCYEKVTTNNGRFAFYDENGNQVTEDGTSSGGGSGEGGSTVVPTEGNLPSYLQTFTLNGRQPVLDTNEKKFYYTLPDSLRKGGVFTTEVAYTLATGYADYKLSIDGHELKAGNDTVNIVSPQCKSAYRITLSNAEGTVVATTPLQFTYLPIVEIGFSPDEIGTNYGNMTTFRVNEGDSISQPELLNAKLKTRGATALYKDKKSYAVKLYDANGESLDHRFFGLRSDNNWILDAMYVDPACMRNRVSTDLWNDFAVAPYHAEKKKKARTGTRGHFVEVFMNGQYHGLYCMTEKMDRKQLDLKKFEADSTGQTQGTVHGLLYKTSQWSYAVHMGHESGSSRYPGYSPSGYNNTLGNETWDNYELKYPDYEKEAVDFAPIYNAVNFVCTASQTEFEQKVKSYFDIATARDYYLFIDLLMATDNHGKNMYYYVYDHQSKYGDLIGMAPWDLDGTWGINWAGSTSYTSNAAQDFDTFLWRYEHGQLGLYDKLAQSTTLSWDNYLAARYAQLRQNQFNPDSLANRFASYASLFADSYADSRERNKWSAHSNIPLAATYAENWAKERVAALDEKYDYNTIIQPLAATTDTTRWYGISFNNSGFNWTAQQSQDISYTRVDTSAVGLAQAQQWAFIPCEGEGYKIKNRATGEYLVSNGTTATLGQEADASLFLLTTSTAENSESEQSPYYCVRVAKDKYLRAFGGALSVGNATDLLASFTITPNSTYIINYASRYQHIPQGAVGMPTYLAQADHLQQYKQLYQQAFTEATPEVIAQLEAMNLLVEQSGAPKVDIDMLNNKYYRLYAANDTTTALGTTPEAKLAIATADEDNIDQIWQIRTTDDGKLTLVHANHEAYAQAADSLSRQIVSLSLDSLGCAAFAFADIDNKLFAPTDSSTAWYLLPVESVRMNFDYKDGEKPYTTAYLPFGISHIEGAQAYVGSEPVRGYMKLNAVDDFARCTGVVLISDGSSDFATLTIGESTNDSSAISGTLTQQLIADTLVSHYFTLGDTLIVEPWGWHDGFLRTSTNLIAANTAYFYSETGAGVIFGEAPEEGGGEKPGGGEESGGGESGGGDEPGGVVGINETAEETSNALPYYDLSGRRVTHPVKGGIYIQGGKKVVVK